ncbi:sulfotransferase 1C3 [Strongylocentrotus purpuratus]|uniref:Sulfotransferase domain-containing protein n=1 Tax=Strongylocentrotus purpuratus TaxID=7668 RepID=A0A7M7P085_STRPU|nr:sulfotransferase 1C3 [Strongylocentrotus purpuratus]
MATANTILLEAAAEDISSIDLFSKTHEYKGVTMFEMSMPEIYESLNTWETRPDDVYLITFPKSGTHWIMEIAHLIMNDLQADKINREAMLFALDQAMSNKVDDVTKVTPGHEVMAKWRSPRIMASHLLEEFAPDQIKKRSKVIYFSRNPKDAAVSYFKFLGPTFPDEMEGWKGFLRLFLSEKMIGGSWFRHVKGWWALRDQPNVLCCKYEDFHKDLRGSIKRVADFLDRPLSDENLNKIVELTEMKGMQKTYQQLEEKMGATGRSMTRLFGQLPFLRKGKVGGWKDEFTVAENEYFDKVYQQNMEGSGLEFKFEL